MVSQTPGPVADEALVPLDAADAVEAVEPLDAAEELDADAPLLALDATGVLVADGVLALACAVLAALELEPLGALALFVKLDSDVDVGACIESVVS